MWSGSGKFEVKYISEDYTILVRARTRRMKLVFELKMTEILIKLHGHNKSDWHNSVHNGYVSHLNSKLKVNLKLVLHNVA